MDAERARILAELGAASDSFAAEGADAPPSADAPPAERPPPAEARPEDAIPDRPENAAVMKCWRCKAYGHRTGDRESAANATGNVVLDAERVAREDPMAALALKRQRDDAAAAPSALEALRRRDAR
ncbi:RNA splicing protein [Aureococcus anophagefferens]|uniref:RNA splicing protein n=1 Tax=Aureococcus anophagefferens TaxID=44056 RepID=A0ABR1FUB8_AURAN